MEWSIQAKSMLDLKSELSYILKEIVSAYNYLLKSAFINGIREISSYFEGDLTVVVCRIFIKLLRRD